MLDYLNTPFDMDDADLASALDDVPFWSFAFGKMIFDNIELRRGIAALDIGYGTGFPLLELSGRLGRTSTVYGIDLWKAGSARARFKAEVLGIDNVVFVDGDAAAMGFDDEMFDLIVCNVGINNFEDPAAVFSECFRVARPGAQVAFTTNPKGHMAELYQAFARTLGELGLDHCTNKLRAHEDHRLTVPAVNRLLEGAGFKVTANVEDAFSWRFLDGTTFFNHPMIMRAFVGGWKEILPPEHQVRFFEKLEADINARAEERGGFEVTVPVAYIEAAK